MTEFQRPVLITGFGIVAQAALPILLQHIKIPYRNITVIDIADRKEMLRPYLAKGLRFVQERVTPLNLSRLLSTYVSRGGLIIDLAWSIDFFDITQWARNNEVLYVNASLESWDPSAELHSKSLFEKSLYSRYSRVVRMAAECQGKTTALFDQGANPGLISCFVKQGLLDIGARVIREKAVSRAEKRRIEGLMDEESFAELSRALGVKAIHCSEIDTQRPAQLKRTDEFVGTWSLEGMWEECIAPCELGWGTHEKWEPPWASHPETGPRNQIILPQMGMNTWVRSWVPEQEFVGMAIPHGESFGISKALTVHDGDEAVYRPTVLYAYLPCSESMATLHELRCRGYEMHPKRRILTDEIIDGSDTMGALIMGHRYQSWWIGTSLSIERARAKVPHVNATAVQVGIGVVAAVLWAIRNPNEGILFPEDLPHQEMLRCARPYLGRVISQPVNWTPLSRHRTYFEENPEAQPDRSDPWQFRNFLFRP